MKTITFTHPHVVLNLYYFILLNTKNIFKDVSTVFVYIITFSQVQNNI